MHQLTLSVSLRGRQVASLEALSGILHSVSALLQDVLALPLLLLLSLLLFLLQSPGKSAAF